MRTLSSLGALALVVALAACSSQQEPAQAALKTAQDAYGAVSAEAQRYVPDQARTVQASLTAAQDAFTKGDYAAALTQAQALPAQITALGTAISAKKAELTTAWTGMAAGVPKLVDAVKRRVDVLGKSKHLPAGITKETFDNAKTGLASATQTWSDATAAAGNGDLVSAMAKANDVKTQVVGIMKSLKMQVPAGAGGPV